jgi:hypothetical protein
MSEINNNSVADTFELDREVFETYDELRLGQKDYNDLLSPPKAKKEAALALLHEGHDADLRAEHNDESYLSERIALMKGWKDGLLASTLDPDVKQLYRWRINEDIANMYMIQASQRGDMRNFNRWNTFIYGEPNAQTYAGAIDWIMSDAETIEHDATNEQVKHAAQTVIDMMPGGRGDKSVLVPDAETFAKVRADHFRPDGFFDEILEGVERPDVEVITQEEGTSIIDFILKNNLGDLYERGRAAGTAWSVNHQQQRFKQPDQFSMSWERFIGLPVGHEAGTHIKEAVNARMGRLGLMVWGLDRFEQGAENRALIREQVPYETFEQFAEQPRWRFILERKIAISYGLGLNEDAPHGSGEVYSLINAIEYMYQIAKTPDDPVRAKQDAQTRTDGIIIRALKGTDGTGGAYRKDEIYLDGGAWKTASERGVQAVVDGDKGKYDIANDRHVDHLQRLGVLESHS